MAKATHPFDISTDHEQVFSTDDVPTDIVPSANSIGTCNSCLECSFYVTEKLMTAEYGSAGYGACAARGVLLDTKTLEQVAPICPVASRTRDGILLGEVIVAINGASATVEREPVVEEEPQLVIEDRLPTDDEIALGIESFVTVLNPKDSAQYAHLPVFADMLWTDVERSKIPLAGGDGNPELYQDYGGLVYAVAASHSAGYVPRFIGPAGVGKTELGRHIAYLMKVPFIRFNFTETTELDEVKGRFTVGSDDNGNQTLDFVVSDLVGAFTKPSVILLDEPNVAPSAVAQFMRPALDASKALAIGETGLIYARSPWCVMLSCENPSWDSRNIGAKTAADADASRTTSFIVDYPPINVEASIVREACKADGYDIPPAKLDLIMKINEDLRRACDFEHGTIDASWGIRSNIMVGKLTRVFGIEGAYAATITNRVEPMMRDAIHETIKTHIR